MSLEQIHALLGTWTGLDPSALGGAALASAVRREMRRLGTDDIDAYTRVVLTRGPEAQALAARFLVHETWFFRYPGSFSLLAKVARSYRAEGRTPFRVLSVPCSTGEEAASIAITLADAGYAPTEAVIDAFDVSTSAVEVARLGYYEGHSFRGFDPKSRPDQFEPEGAGFRLTSETLGRIRYQVGNVLAASDVVPGATYDAIFCRNLMIYMTLDARQSACAGIKRRLASDGRLFVGHAEVPAVVRAGFAIGDPKDAFFCTRQVAAAPESKPERLSSSGPARKAVPAARAVQPSNTVPSSNTGPVRSPVRARATRPASSSSRPPTLVLDRARGLADQGDLGGALRLLEQDVAAGVVSADHYHLMAVVHRAAGREPEMEHALGRALYLDPAHYDALLQSALGAAARGDQVQAKRLRERARRAREDESA